MEPEAAPAQPAAPAVEQALSGDERVQAIQALEVAFDEELGDERFRLPG